MVFGPIPDGSFVCHRCDRPLCVNPYHLFLGTAADNAADMVNKGRSAKGEHHSQATLTGTQVEALRQRYAAGGVSQQELARQYNITSGTASRIIRGLRWRHIPGATITDCRHFTEAARKARHRPL